MKGRLVDAGLKMSDLGKDGRDVRQKDVYLQQILCKDLLLYTQFDVNMGVQRSTPGH